MHGLPCGRSSNVLSLLFAMTLMLAGVSACSQIVSSDTTQNLKPVTIGYSVSLTGDLSADGKALQMGYDLWRDSVNQQGGLLGHQVVLKVYDDASDPKRAVADYQKLIETDHVDLLLGPYSTRMTVPTIHVADEHDYAFVGGAGNGKEAYLQKLQHNSFFMASLPSETSLDSFSEFLLALPVNMRPRTVAYVTQNDPFAVPQVAYAKTILSKGGLKTVFAGQPFSENLQDVSPIAKKVAQSKADVVVFGSVGLGPLESFIKTCQQFHYNPKAFVATSGAKNGADFVKAVGTKGTEGVFVPNSGWYPGEDTYQNDQFTQEYLAKYGGKAEDISSDTVQAYSAGQVLEQAVTQAKSLDNAVLIKTLHEGTFNNLFGPVKFDDQGRNTLGISSLFQWQNDTLVVVAPVGQAQVNPEYPKAPWS
jgi:branched-chain amino acid transport system substrate-binding protein